MKINMGEAAANEMSRLLKIAADVSDDKAEYKCELKLWCCHPSAKGAEVVGKADFDDIEEGRACFFDLSKCFNKDEIEKGAYAELCCEEHDEFALRKNPDAKQEDESEEENEAVEIVLMDAGKITDAGEALMKLNATQRLVKRVARVAAEVDKTGRKPEGWDADMSSLAEALTQG